MRIAYLIPEFPGQTHMFFWRERAALRQIGITAYLVSTRRPRRAIISHDWANQAHSETFYLADIGLRDFLQVGVQFIRLGPKTWIKAVKAAADGCPPQKFLSNLALMFVAVHLVCWMRAKKLYHIHSHSCADSALIALLANRLGDISYSLTLHGNLHDYGKQQNVKWRHASFAITITQKLYNQIQRDLSQDVPRNIGLAPMGVDPAVFKRTNAYKPWNEEGPL